MADTDYRPIIGAALYNTVISFISPTVQTHGAQQVKNNNRNNY